MPATITLRLLAGSNLRTPPAAVGFSPVAGHRCLVFAVLVLIDGQEMASPREKDALRAARR
jgi:hypothetical protein